MNLRENAFMDISCICGLTPVGKSSNPNGKIVELNPNGKVIQGIRFILHNIQRRYISPFKGPL
jgi:hypothetical protein